MKALAGTGALTAIALRRDRIMAAAWIYVIAAWVAGTAYSIKKLYPTAAGQQRFAKTIAGNRLFLTLYDPLFGHSLGALTAWRIGSPVALMAGLMTTFIVVRHTRADEEAGRLELVGATAVGKLAALTAALVVACGAALAVAALTGAGLIALGLPAGSSFGFAVAVASAGVAFAAVTAVAAQVAETARAARGIAIAVVGAAYLLRDLSFAAAGTSWLIWLSPIGWTVQFRAFGGDRWWVLALPVLCAALAVAVAVALCARRDLGAGLFAPRPGPGRAAAWLRGPFALAVRLQRGGLAGWAAGLAAAGAIIGVMTPSVGSLLRTSGGMKDAFVRVGGGGTVSNAFLASMAGLFGLVAAAYAVAATLRLRREETGQRGELVLAGAVGRIRWAASHLAVAAAGAAIVLACAGLAAGTAYWVRSGDPAQVPRLLGAMMAQLPAAWVLAGIAMMIVGFLPRLDSLAWAALVAFLICGLLGPLLRLPQWALDISPYTHVPKLPGGVFTAAPLIWLTLAACLLTAAGLTALRHRDIA
jgi:polyether ionophore transport system permease protein